MSGPAVAAPVLAIVAGMVVVAQTALMSATTARGIGLHGVLFLNSVIGVTLLAVIGLLRDGPRVFAATLGQAAWWSLLPGVLGTLVVFANLFGYRVQGATLTIALFVTAQLVTAVVLDAAGLSGRTVPLGADRIIGVLLLLAGTVLVLRPWDAGR